jgi:hypothetical protein
MQRITSLRLEHCKKLFDYIALTIGIPSSTEEQGLFFKFIAYPKSKRGKKLKAL